MRLTILAVGRLKSGPERLLAERYQERAVKTGRSLGFRGIEVVEIDESRSRDAGRRMTEEAIAIAQAAGAAMPLVVLEADGEAVDSRQFADFLARRRDAGTADAGFVIGGPDGLAPGLRERATLRLAFGTMTWPHQLVRIMLMEQLYRAMTMLAGHPYHRA